MDISDPVVLITGCSSGIGRATAELFDECGWRVWATARNPDVANFVERGCATAALDVIDPEQVASVVDGRIDCLGNNVGYGRRRVAYVVDESRTNRPIHATVRNGETGDFTGLEQRHDRW